MSAAMAKATDQSTETGCRRLSDPALHGDDLPPGTYVGNHVVDELRSRGGFATIYRATHVTLKRVAAIKILHKALVTSKTMIQRFQQEAQAANRIRHPNIIDIYEFGELSDGRPFFIMEWLEGNDLEQELRTRGPFSPTEALAVMEDLGAALQAAHDVGIVHRDLKASNILMVPAGNWYHVKLVDFGIAKLLDAESAGSSELTSTGERLGTPWNMAPEQILGHAVDARTDVYAAGVLLYQILTGVLPFRADTPVEVEELHLKAPPPKASDAAAVPTAVDRVIERSLQKTPEQRFASMSEMLHELRDALSRRQNAGQSGTGKMMAIGFYVEARITDVAAVDDEVLDDLESVIATARRLCLGERLHLALDSAGALMFVSPLSWPALTAPDGRERAIETALKLQAQIAARTGATTNVRFAIVLQIGSVITVLDDGELKLIGGDLMALNSWPSERATNAVTVSSDVKTGLDDRFAFEPFDDARRSWRVVARSAAPRS
jgi:tRNA A-37 threonylcarbamoyl transferase component Bud32